MSKVRASNNTRLRRLAQKGRSRNSCLWIVKRPEKFQTESLPKPTCRLPWTPACRGTAPGCAGRLHNNHRYPVAGLDPATHVCFRREIGSGKDVDARVKPGQGGSFVCNSGARVPKQRRRIFPRTALRGSGNPGSFWGTRVDTARPSCKTRSGSFSRKRRNLKPLHIG